MASTFLNISTDSTLGGEGASDSIVSSQKAIKDYVDEKDNEKVSTSRKINGKPLTSDITLTASDVSALPSSTTIPTTTSSVTSGSSEALTSGGAYTALQSYQTTANLVTSVSSSSTNSQYPSAKLFYDTCGDIETLINAL